MPQRFLRPGIRTSPRWNAVSHRAARLYVAILTLVDDYGRYDGRTAVLWADAFAVWNEQNPHFAVNPQETAADCAQLAAASLVGFYEVGGRRYLQVIQWQENPRSASKWPDPPQEFACNPQRNPAESSGIQPPSSSSSSSSSSSPAPARVSVSGSLSPNGVVPVARLLGSLAKIYKKPEFEATTHMEESTAAQLVRDRGPGIDSELQEIEAYRKKLKPEDLKYFPNSRLSLLEKWQQTLDRARTTESKRRQIAP